jgi:hypothetical protein
MMKSTIVYFDKPGAQNTEEVLRIARARAKKLDIKTVVVATAIGNTGVRATEVFKGMKVVAVTLPSGFKKPDGQLLTKENRKKIIANGGLILTTTPFLDGVSGAMKKKFNTSITEVVITNTLYLMGQGLKVIIEISVMAADAGLVGTEEDIICIAGTAGGADYAVVLKPVHSGDFFDLRIKEILCKPHF